MPFVIGVFMKNLGLSIVGLGLIGAIVSNAFTPIPYTGWLVFFLFVVILGIKSNGKS